MAKQKVLLVIMLLILVCGSTNTQAQVPIADIIKQGVTKVIKAVDLKIQRLQTKTIWLQNAQKVIENSMSQLHLDEITDWAEKQKDLYQDYYKGLTEVKSVISYYHQIKDISLTQTRLVSEYNNAWHTMQSDKHFSADELVYMSQVYTGILDESVNNTDQLLLVVNSFVTQMTDAKRLQIIGDVAEKVSENYKALHQFNNQNALLSYQRAKDIDEASRIKEIYGLSN